VRMDWDAIQTDLQVPHRLPSLFDGDRATIYARITGGQAGDVSIVADGPGGEMRFAVHLDPDSAAPDQIIPTLMARAAIQELEEGRSKHFVPGGSAQAESRRASRVRALIVELGCRYNLMSSATSFVAVEEREAGSHLGRAELRRVPVALTSGWHGIREQKVYYSRPITPPPMPSSPAPGSHALVRLRFGPKTPQRPVPSKKAPNKPAKLAARKRCFSRPFDRSEPPAPPPPDPLIDLIARQDADGAWPLDSFVAKAASIKINKLKRAAADLAVAERLAFRIVATLVVLHLLDRLYADRRDEWNLPAQKSKRWLAAQPVRAPAGHRTLTVWIAHVLDA
jgi:Ca-activated chloride channel homolog